MDERAFIRNPRSMPELSAALQGLRGLDIHDFSRFKAAVEAGRQTGWAYYFPYLLSKNRPGRSAVLVTEEHESLCLFQWSRSDTGERLDLLFPPMPMSLAALEHSLERANDCNGDRSARVLRIDAQDADAVAAARSLRVKPRREQYLFAPRTYENLAGKKCYTIRRNVALVERLPDVEVAPYSTTHAEACLALLARWKKAHRGAHGSEGGVGTSRRAIELVGKLPDKDLGGEVVFLDGRLSAFAFGGELRSGLACSYERKCDTQVRGLSYYHFRSFLLSLRDFGLVNDGSDTGRAGLRQLKASFRPVEMHVEYRATQRSS